MLRIPYRVLESSQVVGIKAQLCTLAKGDGRRAHVFAMHRMDDCVDRAPLSSVALVRPFDGCTILLLALRLALLLRAVLIEQFNCDRNRSMISRPKVNMPMRASKQTHEKCAPNTLLLMKCLPQTGTHKRTCIIHATGQGATQPIERNSLAFVCPNEWHISILSHPSAMAMCIKIFIN